jgi:hypothetical protein
VTPSRRSSTSARLERDQLLERIRALVRNRADGANRASMRAQTREIERLKQALAESVKRHPN